MQQLKEMNSKKAYIDEQKFRRALFTASTVFVIFVSFVLVSVYSPIKEANQLSISDE